MYYNKKVGGMMGIVSLRLNETEEEIFRSYAIHTGKTCLSYSNQHLLNR